MCLLTAGSRTTVQCGIVLVFIGGLDSIAILGTGPLRDPLPHLLLSTLLCVSKWGLLFDERKV
jgi:hypothetical protein